MRVINVDELVNIRNIKVLTTVWKKECSNASLIEILFLGSTTSNFLIKSFGASGTKQNIYFIISHYFLKSSLNHVTFNVIFLPVISAHSGDVKEYFPSIIFLSITICFRCQNGGLPTNSVNIITPQAHLLHHEHKN